MENVKYKALAATLLGQLNEPGEGVCFELLQDVTQEMEVNLATTDYLYLPGSARLLLSIYPAHGHGIENHSETLDLTESKHVSEFRSCVQLAVRGRHTWLLPFLLLPLFIWRHTLPCGLRPCPLPLSDSFPGSDLSICGRYLLIQKPQYFVLYRGLLHCMSAISCLCSVHLLKSNGSTIRKSKLIRNRISCNGALRLTALAPNSQQ